jgi:hypothetical protein
VHRCSCNEEKDSVVCFCVRLEAVKGYEKRLPVFSGVSGMQTLEDLFRIHSCSTVSIIWEVIFEETLVAPGVTEPLQRELTSSGR